MALGVEVGQDAFSALFQNASLHLILGQCDDTTIPVISRRKRVSIDERFTELRSQIPSVPRVRLNVHVKDTTS